MFSSNEAFYLRVSYFVSYSHLTLIFQTFGFFPNIHVFSKYLFISKVFIIFNLRFYQFSFS